jgi:hypothetical protein
MRGGAWPDCPGKDETGPPPHGYPQAMKLWLDDIRRCPDGYIHARSVNEAIKAA